MSRYFNSINGRLTFSLALLSIIILSLFSFLYSRVIQINRVSNYDERVEDLNSSIIMLLNNDNQFYYYEKYETNFMDSLTESNVDHRADLISSILSKIEALNIVYPKVFKTNEHNTLDSLNSYLEKYNTIASKIIVLAAERGFRDFGLEGKMRNAAHQLEQHDCIPMSKLLTLRRHEKDYFLRNDTIYVNKLLIELNSLLNSSNTCPSAKVLLNTYKNNFIQIVRLEENIGLNPNVGLRASLGKFGKKTEELSNILSEESSNEISRIVGISQISFLVALFITSSISLIIVIILTRHLARPIIKLTKQIDSNTYQNINPDTRLEEIQILANAFENKQVQISEKVKELKRKNRTLKKVNSELDLFVYSTAHDLKAPLSSLLGLIGIMKMEKYSKHNFEEYLSMMERSIYKLNDFITDIIFYSKNNRTTIAPEKINFGSLIENLLIHFQYLKNTSKINFVIKVDESVEYKSDKVRIEAIIRNLVSNAIRYTDLSKDSPSIWISVYLEGKRIIIEITDNGIGIHPEHQDKIFKMFYRASENSAGSGLGLFIVKEMVGKLRGKFSFKSTYGEGTLFKISIPNKVENISSNDLLKIKNVL